MRPTSSMIRGIALMSVFCTQVDAHASIPDQPATLSEAGLYENIATGELAPNVVPFAPTYALWTDGASKRRWVYLPPGTTIDNIDEKDWVLPVGTRLYKEFSRDGRRLETRLLYKRGDNDWFRMAYIWNNNGPRPSRRPPAHKTSSARPTTFRVKTNAASATASSPTTD